jgi:cytochrome oxidase Cu insertion factor (SCO1/SenC/PrrC family)
MATWCPPCLEQQREAAVALAQLAPDKVVYVSVDVDPQEDASTLAAYADRHAFPWHFVVASPAFLRLLAHDFGLSVLNPPATPVVIISPAGDGTLTPAGIKSAAQLVALARQLGG